MPCPAQVLGTSQPSRQPLRGSQLQLRQKSGALCRTSTQTHPRQVVAWELRCQRRGGSGPRTSPEVLKRLQNLPAVHFGLALAESWASPRSSSASARGRLRHSSSSDASCITIKAAMLLCFAVMRRHSRRYSRRAGSTSRATCLDGRLAPRPTLFRLGSGIAGGRSVSQPGSPLQVSHAEQLFQFGVSPKCAQIR